MRQIMPNPRATHPSTYCVYVIERNLDLDDCIVECISIDSKIVAIKTRHWHEINFGENKLLKIFFIQEKSEKKIEREKNRV